MKKIKMEYQMIEHFPNYFKSPLKGLSIFKYFHFLIAKNESSKIFYKTFYNIPF